MAEVFAVRLLDALDGEGPHVRSHDGKQLLRRYGDTWQQKRGARREHRGSSLS
jgi:hypothetical protein